MNPGDKHILFMKLMPMLINVKQKVCCLSSTYPLQIQSCNQHKSSKMSIMYLPDIVFFFIRSHKTRTTSDIFVISFHFSHHGSARFVEIVVRQNFEHVSVTESKV